MRYPVAWPHRFEQRRDPGPSKVSLRRNPEELPDINLNAAAGGESARSGELAANAFRDVGPAAVGADFCEDGLED